jgi:hypothetical protein
LLLPAPIPPLPEAAAGALAQIPPPSPLTFTMLAVAAFGNEVCPKGESGVDG